jgi:hypothetical protein
MTRTSLTREQKFAMRLLSFRDQRLKMWKLGVKPVRDKFMPAGIGKQLLASLFPSRSCRPWKPGLGAACLKTRPGAEESLPMARAPDSPKEAVAIE